jgi:glycosyltransferase involved in cell wall biosynthesis
MNVDASGTCWIPGLVSVVIPTRDAEQYIGATLDSIGAQAYRDWEVIVVEDGPAGPSRDIVAAFAARFPGHRVDYSHHPRSLGPSAARNTALTRATGEFVALLDSDDRWLPSHLSRSVDQLRHTGADVVYSTAIMVDDETDNPIGVWGPSKHELRIFPQALFSRSTITPSATVFRRQILADVGPWDTSLRYAEDFSFWMNCVRAGKTFAHLGGVHCLYRKNHGAALTRNMSRTVTVFAEVAEQYLQYALPGTRAKWSRRMVAEVYRLAATAHATIDRRIDPSADRGQAARLAWRGWKLHRRRIFLLVLAGRFAVAALVSRRSAALAGTAESRPENRQVGRLKAA